ncbi:MAG: TonB-dependent receptor [Candidatus Solibacter sp.]|nr:TonB-dependent receptor [Candidatus Solibacter sp.]
MRSATPVGCGPACWILLFCPFLLAAQTPDPRNQDPPKPEPVKTSITVVEKISAETPANVTVLDQTTLQQSPGTNLDDRLREVPGFSLFRRSSSLVAHPTTQGISLRGIGSSGASRTLVFWDGIPANDPFGGWVYWTQFVPDEIGRAEISRGASTSIFGDRAMSGAIGLFSRQPEKLHLLAEYQFGNLDTHDLSAGFSHAWSRLAISGAARAFTTDGYYIVPAAIRGAADRPASVRFVTSDVRIDRYTSFGNLFFKTSVLAEERQNGTVLTHNSTGLGTVSMRYVREFTSDSLSLVGFHTREGFHSTFSSVTADRNTDRLTFTQTVPSEAVGGAALWQHHASRWNLLGGADVYRVEGASTDHLVPPGLRVGGGTQLQHGVFGQADATFGPLRLFAGARHSFAGQGNQFLSPNGGFVIGGKRLRARGSVYRSFRAPTLNELYREFRAGNATTRANPALLPETLWGAEAGFDFTGETGTLRVTAYRNALNGLITNVTLSSTPAAIVRQRANAAAALSRGLEAEFRRRLRNFTGEWKYLYVESRYVTGFRVAQIPKHQGTAQLTYQRPGTLVSLGLRSYAYQFDDDLNVFRLPGYASAQFVIRQHVARALSAEVTLENAFDRRFYTAFTPTPNIGAPRLWRVGLRWDGRLR